MSKQVWWRGVEGVRMIDHGEWSDPELAYGKVVAYHWYVEESLAGWFKEESGVDDVWDGNHEKQFSLWCQCHKDFVIEAISECQTVENRYNMTHLLWDKILNSLTDEEYAFVWATLRYKKCKLSEIEDFELRIKKVIDEFTESESLMYDWWKMDYGPHTNKYTTYFQGKNITCIEDLFFAMEDGF